MARIRTFVGVDIGTAVRREAATVIRILSDASSAVAWVPPENLHITLKFLGDVEDRDIYEVCRAVRRAVTDRQSFRIVGLGVNAFPNMLRPRTLWINLDDSDGKLVELHEQVAESCDTLGFPREVRAYVPHITLGRVRAGRQHVQSLIDRLPEVADREFGYVTVDQCVIYSSELTAGGPVYTPMGHATLSDGSTSG